MNCEQLKSTILEWVGREFECRKSEGDHFIATLPILKPNGDAIEVGIEPMEGDRWRLTDLGDTYATLYLAGVDLFEEYVRAAEFKQIVTSYRLVNDESNQELMLESNNLAEGIFDFAHAIQSMLALQLTVQPKQPKRDFPSVVAKFLAEQHASFEVPSDHIDGKTGRWKFNFVMNHVRPEVLVKTITARNKGDALRSAQQSVFEITDILAIRKTLAVVVADDEDGRQDYWQPNVLRIFTGYDIPIYPFHARRNELTEFVAGYVVHG